MHPSNPKLSNLVYGQFFQKNEVKNITWNKVRGFSRSEINNVWTIFGSSIKLQLIYFVTLTTQHVQFCVIFKCLLSFTKDIAAYLQLLSSQEHYHSWEQKKSQWCSKGAYSAGIQKHNSASCRHFDILRADVLPEKKINFIIKNLLC